MSGLVRLALCSTLLSVCTLPALADSVSVTGNVSFTPSSLTFAPPFATQNDSGIFSRFGAGTVNYMLGTVNYTLGIPQSELAFTITNGSGDVLAFYDQVNSPTQTFDANGNLQVTLDETGYYTFNGGQAYAGIFNLGFDGTTPLGAANNVPFLGTGELLVPPPVFAAIAPEPGSLLLLSTGFLGLAGLLRNRWRAAEAS